METIKISKAKFKKLSELYKNFYEVYGDEKTIWELDDLEEMRKIGQEFMEIFTKNFYIDFRKV